MVMMITIISYVGYLACTQWGYYGKCGVDNIPDISQVMGDPPVNKLYAIMLTIYSATKLAEARAYYNRLSTFVSPLFNAFLFGAAVIAMFSGPAIGYYDCFFDLYHH